MYPGTFIDMVIKRMLKYLCTVCLYINWYYRYTYRFLMVNHTIILATPTGPDVYL